MQWVLCLDANQQHWITAGIGASTAGTSLPVPLPENTCCVKEPDLAGGGLQVCYSVPYVHPMSPVLSRAGTREDTGSRF